MSKTLKTDLICNYASFAVMAASGLVMNFVVAKFYSAEVLGVFNQVLAFYIMGSQFAVGGVHYSTLQAVAKCQDDRRRRSEILINALLLALVFGLLTWFALHISKDLISMVLESPAVGEGVVYVAPALMLYSLNKVLIAALNGMQRMKAFALCQAFRSIALVLILLYAAHSSWQGTRLSQAFLFAEAALFLVSGFLCLGSFSWHKGVLKISQIIEHAKFGIKGFMSGVFLEINTRVDVLMVGFFMSDRDVGIYSLAAIFAEGLVLLLAVVKNLVNPMLAKLIAAGEFSEIKSLVRKSWKYLYPGMAFSILCAVGAFWLFLQLSGKAEVMDICIQVFLFLAAGVLIASGLIPFDGILVQAGQPGWHTGLTVMIVLTNSVLNLLLIPHFGLIGAAMATAVSIVCSAIYLNFLCRKRLSFSLL